MKTLLPAVRAQLAERYIFNFRMPLPALRRYLPAPWLQPQDVGGYGVASFCVLDLRHIVAAPLPASAGLHSLSCAPRYAVLDCSGERPQPAVFVTERQTNNAFGAWFTGLGFSCRHPYVRARIAQDAGATQIRVDQPGQEFCFHASVRRSETLRSSLFRSPDEFSAFIAQGVTSYGLSRYERRLTKVDLHKEDFGYEPLDVLSLHSPLTAEWQRHGAALDSAFRTAGGRYEWSYHGLTDATQEACA